MRVKWQIPALTMVLLSLSSWTILKSCSHAVPEIDVDDNAIVADQKMLTAPTDVEPRRANAPELVSPKSASKPEEEEVQLQAQAQIQDMLDARNQEMESKLKTQYDERLKELQRQLEASRRANADERKLSNAGPSKSTNEGSQVALNQEPAAPQADLPPRASAPTSRPQSPPTRHARKSKEDLSSAPLPTVSDPEAPDQSPLSKGQQKVTVGDLVSPSSSEVVPPRLISRLAVRYPQAARHLKQAAQVDIKVLVDEQGRVLDTALVGSKAGFGFDEAALEAARRAVFQPATKDGVRVKMWTTLRVNFKAR